MHLNMQEEKGIFKKYSVQEKRAVLKKRKILILDINILYENINVFVLLLRVLPKNQILSSCVETFPLFSFNIFVFMIFILSLQY